MFAKLSSQRLRALAEDLRTLGEQSPDAGQENVPDFAKCLSVCIRCELARRTRADDE